MTLGVGSRSEVQKLVKKGGVKVNDTPVKDPGMQVDEHTARLTVNGTPVDGRLTRHVMLHKPAGLLTAARDKKQPTVMDLLPEVYASIGCMPVGRLDKDTTGLLLFSTNGSFIHFVTDEKNKIAKTYRVKLKKALTKEEQAFYEKQLESGIMLEAEKKAKPAFVKNQKVQWESENSCLFTIKQGIFHQVRRSFAALGNEVVELHRVKIGDLELPANLQPGNVKILLINDIVKK